MQELTDRFSLMSSETNVSERIAGITLDMLRAEGGVTVPPIHLLRSSGPEQEKSMTTYVLYDL